MDSSDLHHSLSSSSTGGHLAAGAVLGPYRIVRRIAIGGMGAVYEAQHQQLGRSVALKTMLFDAGGEDAQRFLNEARIVAGIDHPHVIRVTDAGQVQGVRYLAMELIDGPSLAARLQTDGPLEPDDAAELMRQVAGGVHAAHLQGVLHRDVKPSNILIDPHGNARLGDFGTARDTGNARLTATGVVLGTPSYMAPEQALGEEEPTPLIDVYGLGATLYHLLAGTPPFEKASQLATMQAVVSEEAPPLETLRPELPADLCAVCHKCLAKDPAERYDSALSLAEDLRRFVAGEPTRARPLGPLRQAARVVRRNAVLVAGTTALTLAVSVLAILAVLPLFLSRSLSRLEQSAVSWREARVTGLEAELDGAPSPARLRAIRAALAWERLQADAAEALGGASDGADGERAQAIRRGLGDASAHRARVSPTLARIALRLAGTADPDAPELVEASIHDPDGPPGRTARLRLARRLHAGDDPRGHALGLIELKALARGDDAVAQRARVGLALSAAQHNDWAGVLDALAGVTAAEGKDEALRTRLGDLAKVLRSTCPLPADASYLFLPGAPPQVALCRTSELALMTLTKSGLQPSGRADLTQSGRKLVRAFAVRGWGDHVLAAVLQEGDTLRLVGALRRGPRRLSLQRLGTYGRRGEYGMRALTSGDFDGDGATDLALVPYQNSHDAALVWGGEQVRMSHLDPRAARRPFGFDHAAAADLDGDGRDELILAPSVFYTGLEVYRCEPSARRMTKTATIPTGWVRGLRTLRLGRRDALIVTVDYRGFEQDLLKRSPQRPWLGRDGVYVIEDRGQGPALTARWTVGPDQVPDAASRFQASALSGFGLTLGGEPWLVRSYRDVHGVARWELAPWSALSLTRPPADPLRLIGTRGVPQAVIDLDGDGDQEVVLGNTLHGYGAAPAGTWTAPPAERTGAPDRLLRAARTLRYLGLPEAAAELRTRLLRAHPDSWAAQVGELEGIDDLLWRATRAHQRVEQASQARDRDAGRAAHAEWVRLLRQAAAEADAKAATVTLRGACLAKAARARTALGEYDAARRGLEAALEVDGLADDTRVRLWERKRLLERLAALTPVELPLERSNAPALGVLRPDGVRFVPGGIAIRCSGGVEDGCVTRVELDPRPLRVEAHIALDGAVWCAALRLGLAPADDREAFTGIAIGLHDVATNELSVFGIVGGRATGPRCSLPRFTTELHVAIDLTPMAGGESELTLEVRDAKRELLFHTSRLVALKTPVLGLHDIGVISPRARNVRSLNQEQKTWRMSGWATVRSLRVLGLRPQRRADRLPRLWSSHAQLSAGRPTDAAREALRATEEDPAAASWALGFALARQGRLSDGARQLVLAAERDPHRALLWFEDLSESVGEADRPVVDAALKAMLSHRDPLLVATARSLRGRLQAPVDDSLLQGAPARRLAALHLRLRNVYSKQRYSHQRPYLQGRKTHEVRLPRHRFPQVIPALSDNVPLDAILRPGSDPVETHLRYLSAARTHPKSHLPWRRLATLYHRLGLLALAAEATERELQRAPPDQRREGWLRLASLRTSAMRRPAAVDAVLKYLEAGGRQDRLKPFDAYLGSDPRYKAAREP